MFDDRSQKSTGVNTKPANEEQFNALRQDIKDQCSLEDFKSGLQSLNPTPAQVLQVLEVTLLSEGAYEEKAGKVHALGEHVARNLREVPVRGDEQRAMELIGAYRASIQMVASMEDMLGVVASNKEGADGLTAEDINAYQFAKAQDTLRFTLRVKQLPYEERSDYKDPAPEMLERSREDFLDGKGIIDPSTFLR